MSAPLQRLAGAHFFVLAALVAVAPGCLGFGHYAQDEPLPQPWAEAGMRRFEVDAGRFIGLSDLASARDDDGALNLFVLPERQRAILRLQAPKPALAPLSADKRPRERLGAEVSVHHVVGIPPAYDTESLAVLSPNTFAIGTEAPWPQRAHDEIFIVSAPFGAGPQRILRFDYAPFALLAESNKGLEGMCSAGNVLLVASESSGMLADGRRFAPMGRALLPDGQFLPLRLLLTSEAGNISALTCRRLAAGEAAAAAVEVLAIERHYHTCRLLRFRVPLQAGPLTSVQPEVVLDLAAGLVPLRNYEGIAWLPNGDVLLVADNSMGFPTGPTEALLVPKQLVQAR